MKHLIYALLIMAALVGLLLLPVGSYAQGQALLFDTLVSADDLSDAESNLAICLLDNQDLAEQNEYIKDTVGPMAADYLQNIEDYNNLLQAIQQHFREEHPDEQ